MDWPYPDYYDPAGSGFEYDDDPGPTVQQIAKAVADGLICCQCGESFVKKHNRKTACSFCFARMTPEEIKDEGIRLAVHDEGTANAFKQRARKARKAKESK